MLNSQWRRPNLNYSIFGIEFDIKDESSGFRSSISSQVSEFRYV